MYSQEHFISCPHNVDSLKALNEKLNAKVVEQMNCTQELIMMNSFARESNEYLFKKSLHERFGPRHLRLFKITAKENIVKKQTWLRFLYKDLSNYLLQQPRAGPHCKDSRSAVRHIKMSDIASWRWVLLDLTKRLEDMIDALKHEHNALRVVIKRIQDEVEGHSRDASKPGALSPLSDFLEDAILQEYNFLREQKKKFESMILDIEKRISSLNKTKKRIEADVLSKQQSLTIDEACGSNSFHSTNRLENEKKKKKRGYNLARWNKRCENLKKSGLRILSNAIITRQQARGARVHLSIAAQSYAARVDSALRRRLHCNKVKLQDLNWQREEAVRDYKTLDEELTITEQNLLETMDQERIVETRLADRTLRPVSELTKDEVNKKLGEELCRLRSFSKQLRINLERITSLQHYLSKSITRIDCCVEDIVNVIRLDEERIHYRLGEEPELISSSSTPLRPAAPPPNSEVSLSAIQEENEDDYPFDT